MRWWGWGSPDRASALPEHVVGLLRQEVGISERRHEPVDLAQVSLPASRLGAGVRSRLERAVGANALRDDHEARVLHCAGKGYPDLFRLRAGAPEGAPDVVLYPASEDQIDEVLAICVDTAVAVVPFGGGTSVVGGVAPLRGDMNAVVALDLRRLDRLVSLDHQSLTAVVQAGMRGPELERELGRQGLTLGHFPQSFQYVTIGGCVATRSAGQSSTGYGRIDELVLGLRCSTPSGAVVLPVRPASAAGPDLRQLMVGSEGALGVITEAALRVSAAPQVRHYEGVFFRSFAEGAEAFRHAVQEHAAPDVARLSDEDETRLTLALAGRSGFLARAGTVYLGARGYAQGCLAIVGWEGTPDEVDRRRAAGRLMLQRHGGLTIGLSPGRAWARTRFDGPYLRDDLLTLGVMVETLETAAQWSGLAHLHSSVKEAIATALAGRGTPALVGCHVSHLYESGASLYFTFLARQEEGSEMEQWEAAKVAASEAIVAAGATITHHHAIGRDHARWLGAEDGPRGLAALRALKAELDPVGIMNPGKLLHLERL
jgi:alkyldihydroxyacetonephosphate synthase